MMTSAQRKTIRYLVRQYAEPKGWDVTTHELARYLGERGYKISARGLAVVCKDWHGRMRGMSDDIYRGRNARFVIDATFSTANALASDIARQQAENEE